MYRTGRMASTRRERIKSITTLGACQYNCSSFDDVIHRAYSCVHVHALNRPIVKQYTSKEWIVIVPQESIIIRISRHSSTGSVPSSTHRRRRSRSNASALTHGTPLHDWVCPPAGLVNLSPPSWWIAHCRLENTPCICH